MRSELSRMSNKDFGKSALPKLSFWRNCGIRSSMIYETIAPEEQITQGDIFQHVPRVDFDLSNLAVMDDEEARETSWQDLRLGAEITAVLAVKSVTGIVVTQNCDARRGEYLYLCQVDPFLAVLGQNTPPKSPEKWQKLIVTQARTNHRLYYLPGDERVGFSEPMVADFRIVIRVSRKDLEELRENRVGRLNNVAIAHFRESFSQYFRRYAYDEWYPLSKDQFDAYAADSKEVIEAYPWQR